MNTRFGILAGLALVTFISVFTAMLALGAISPLGVQGADHPIDDNGQAVDFQPQMVAGVSVANTNQGPGEVSGFRFQFTTPDALTANEDAITVHFDKDFKDLPEVLSRGNVTVSAMASSGSATTDANGPSTTGAYIPYSDATREILTTGKHGLSNSAALNNVEYTFYVPDMNGDIEGAPGIAAGATVSVHVSPGAGIRNPTEGGSKGPIGVFTSMQSMMDTSLKITVDRTLQLSDYDTNRNKSLTIIGKGFQNGTNATIYLDNANGTRQALVSVLVANDDTFSATIQVTVPPFVPGKGNMIYVEDENQPPNVSNRLDFEIEGLLTVSPTSAAVGDVVDLALEDWPDGPIPAGAVTIAGVTQRIIGSPSVSGDSATFRIEIGTDTPSGTNEIRVTANGESDHKKITIIEGTLAPPDPSSVAADRAALVALYIATDGANWTNNSDWLTDAPVYEWYGVSVDPPEGRVFALSLQSNGLSGEIPKALGSLTNLTRMYLSKNQLTGEIPAELGSLTHLIELDFYANQLSGEIPVELGRLTNLARLDLSGNQLSREIPSELGRLTNLARLDLSGNQLSGEIPSELGDLTNLTGLDLTANQLSGETPSELGRLTNLTRLSLSANQLSGEAPEELGSLTNLTRLDLHSNQLSGEIPKNLGSLTNLGWLDLYSNQLSGEVPAELGGLTNLEYLFLGGNQLGGEIPAELGSLTNLIALNLSGNQLSGEIPAELSSLTNLTELDFYANQLSGEIPAELGSLTNLRELVLWGNQLSGEIPAELGNLTNLGRLDLYSNQLSGEIPGELGGLTNLGWLDLYSNQLSGEIPGELGNLINLRYLRLGGNQLTGCVPVSLRSVESNDFVEIGLPFCDILAPGSVEGDRAALVALYKATDGANWRENSGWLTDAPLGQWYGVETGNTGRVTVLHLSANRLTGQMPGELGSLRNLTHLYLNNNQLSVQMPVELGSLTNLTWLDLSHNQLSGELPAELGSLSNLRSLHLEGNRLSGELPRELGSLTGLIELYLSYNQLSGELPAELGSLTNLKSLHLEGNRLSGKLPEELGSLTNLKSGLYLERQSVERRDTGGAGQPDQPLRAVPQRQSVERRDTGGAGQPDQPLRAVHQRQSAKRRDTGGAGQPDQLDLVVPRQQSAKRGDTIGTGEPDQPDRAAPNR